MTLGECYIIYDIDPDILLYDIEQFIFDIERETSISTTLFLTFDIENFSTSKDPDGKHEVPVFQTRIR